MNHYSISKANQKRKEQAEEIINTTIDLKMPNEHLLNEHYGHKLTDMAQQQIDSYITAIKRTGTERNEPIKPIQTIDITQTELGQAIIIAGDMRSIVRAKNALIQQRMPEEEDLKEIYGAYSEDAKTHFELFNYFGKTRSCDLPFNIHPLRGSGVIKVLKYDENSRKPQNFYVTLMAFHDSAEDVSCLLYPLNDIDKFYEEFIPQEFHEPVSLLTNETGIIYNHFKNNGTTIKNKQDLEKNLTQLKKNLTNQKIKTSINQMLDNMPPPQKKSDFNKYADYAKLWHYDNVYLENLVTNTINTTEYVVLETKGVGDVGDNSTSLQARALDGQRKSIRKALLLNNRSKKIISTLQPSTYRDIFESRNNDLLHFANYSIKEIAISYLSKDFHKQEHLISGLKTLKESKHGIYQNLKREKQIQHA